MSSTEKTFIVYLQSITTLGIPVEAVNEDDAVERARETLNNSTTPYCYFNVTDFKCADVEMSVKD